MGKNNYATIFVYENNYLIVELILNKFVSLNQLNKHLEIIRTFIKLLKKITSYKLIRLPETNQLFKKFSSGSIPHIQLLSLNVRSVVNMTNKMDINNAIKNLKLISQNLNSFIYPYETKGGNTLNMIYIIMPLYWLNVLILQVSTNLVLSLLT